MFSACGGLSFFYPGGLFFIIKKTHGSQCICQKSDVFASEIKVKTKKIFTSN